MRRWRRGVEPVGDRHQLIRVRILVTTPAHSGCLGPHRHRPVGVDLAGDVAQATRRRRLGKASTAGARVQLGRVTLHCVRLAEVEAGLEGVGEIPPPRRCVEHPLLEACRRRSGGRGVGVGCGRVRVVARSLIGDVKGRGVCEPRYRRESRSRRWRSPPARPECPSECTCSSVRGPGCRWLPLSS